MWGRRRKDGTLSDHSPRGKKKIPRHVCRWRMEKKSNVTAQFGSCTGGNHLSWEIPGMAGEVRKKINSFSLLGVSWPFVRENREILPIRSMPYGIILHSWIPHSFSVSSEETNFWTVSSSLDPQSLVTRSRVDFHTCATARLIEFKPPLLEHFLCGNRNSRSCN